ncbi:iron chelate uptake ABC transporter family permease subunit [Rhizobiales bacterium RZME27]|uniref:Iron chelate uptake ABC transporter family permease subunit n=1 Tax=Endobacterium cereale TaxID=2663029 RepID=A0A6A8A8F3_9HYPH|nr:iron ABC transporter permease [Endobacterium cereale]MEB2844624.1 iron ABC transporter permease [Endobacterium cereale]MQY45061.1 iron chelate uptake ABC transporter family permease subunit [Endobacterium cereale]
MMRQYLTLRIGPAIHFPIRLRPALMMLALIILLGIGTLYSLRLGSTDLSMSDVIRWLMSWHDADPETSAIMILRWPRIIVAILAGAMIATSGYLLQVVARNGLADPGLLGISQGGMAAVVLGVAVFGLSPAWLAWAGLAGGFATAFFVMALAYRLSSSTGLILVGLAVGIVLSAAIEIIMVRGGILQFARWLAWSHGSLTSVSVGGAGMVAIWAAVLLPMALIASGQMMPLLLGHEQAAGIGASPRRLSLFLTMIAAALAAPIVAVVGPIAFLGLIAGHIARALVGERPAEVMPVTMLCGALILLIADTAGRTLFLPVIVPAGILVSIAGVLTFLIAARLSPSSR